MILNFLLNTDSHPTAEGVFLAVRSLLPQISFATVYRNLNNLVEETLIQTLDFDKGPAHYCARRNDGHFICDTCGQIFDVMSFDSGRLTKKVIKDLRVKVSKQTFYFFGQCADCAKPNTIEKKWR